MGNRTCPKCGYSQPPSDTCLKCGIIFERYWAKRKSQGDDICQTDEPQSPITKPSFIESIKGPLNPLIKTPVLLGLLGGGAGFLYLEFIEPRLQAANFNPILAEVGAKEFTIPAECERFSAPQVPYRTGRMLVVQPEYRINKGG